MRYLALMFVLASCGDNKPAPEPDEQLTAAERVWVQQVYPIMLHTCMTCHDGSALIDSGFLAGDTPLEVRDSLLASDLVDISSPETSRLLTKGFHSGPSLTAAQAAVILEWLRLEQQ